MEIRRRADVLMIENTWSGVWVRDETLRGGDVAGRP
jgi:hypothetical protein